jgi:hypothetical protein
MISLNQYAGVVAGKEKSNSDPAKERREEPGPQQPKQTHGQSIQDAGIIMALRAGDVPLRSLPHVGEWRSV